jgi:hypothetical protein
VKVDPRVIVTCDEIEEIVFGSRFDPEKTHGRRKNRRARALPEKDGVWRSVDMASGSDGDGDSDSDRDNDNDSASDEKKPEDAVHEDDEPAHYSDTDGSVPSIDGGGGVRIRPPQVQSQVNFSVGGERGRQEKIDESTDDLARRRQGAKRAEEREMVRRAARRGVVFGFEVPRRAWGEPVRKKPVKKTKGKGKRGDDDEEEEGGEVEAVVATTTTEIRKAEAMMAGMVVEPSYAKGNWSIRWRQ